MCGILGVFGNSAACSVEASRKLALGLHQLRHRGQEGAGVVTFDGNTFYPRRKAGDRGYSFEERHFRELRGSCGIAQTRYSTTGQKNAGESDQGPLFRRFSFGGVAVAHNGNLVNAARLFETECQDGARASGTDTEVVLHLIGKASGRTFLERLRWALHKLPGAYAFLFLTEDPDAQVVAVRGPRGIRPLIVGRDPAGTWYAASESCALDILDAKEERRELLPGEIVSFGRSGIESAMLSCAGDVRFCIFESIYFSHPSSEHHGISVYRSRREAGALLAREAPADADVVVGIPDSGIPAAIGFSQQSGIPFELGLIRSHFVGRVFIEPTEEQRNIGVMLKHSPVPSILRGKRVVLVDDSIVRGTTSKKLVAWVRSGGAREVHVRIASPPTTHPCFYGIDTPDRDQLVASRLSVKDTAAYIGADSLAHVSLEALLRTTAQLSGGKIAPGNFCHACFSGAYPIPAVDRALGLV